MIRSKEFKKYLDFAFKAYQESNAIGQEYRQNGNVPFMTHPLGAAMLLIADTLVPKNKRELGVKILILHDVLEDTLLPLPDWIEDEVKNGVKEMTFSGKGDLTEKIEWVMNKDLFFKLLILYDAFWTLYERHVDGPILRQKAWQKGVVILTNEVEKEYGNLRIVQIAKTVAENTY